MTEKYKPSRWFPDVFLCPFTLRAQGARAVPYARTPSTGPWRLHSPYESAKHGLGTLPVRVTTTTAGSGDEVPPGGRKGSAAARAVRRGLRPVLTYATEDWNQWQRR